MSNFYARQSNIAGRLKTLIMAITRNPSQTVNQLSLAAKLFTRRIKRLPVAGQFVLFVSFLCCTVLYGFVLYSLFGNQLTRDRYLELNTCPACFGFTLCNGARDGNVKFTGWSKVRPLDYVNDYNIFDGTVDEKIVKLTKLGRDSDISLWERKICSMAGNHEGCDVSKAALKSLTPSGTRWMVSHLKGLTNMTACPTERLIEKMMDKYREKNDAIVLSSSERVQLVTTLMLNQEPILFQMFSKSEGWPFLGYVGACGRFVAYEANWSPLSRFLDETWLIRAHLALKLLSIAGKLTDNKSQYGIYWTDVSYDDFGVDDRSGNVVVVNGRNLMVVDRFQIKEDKKSGWNEPLYSTFDDCFDGSDCAMSRSESGDLCTRHVADRNYYAVCRYILSPTHARHRTRQVGGLLHDVPTEDDTVYGITELVEACARPTRPGERFDSAAQLVTALTEIVGFDAI